MAGTINIALTQQFDMDGRPLSGGLLYFFAAGTTTPQNAFQDTDLSIVHPNPVVLDASGRVPMFYLADGFIKIRMTTKSGVTILAQDQLLVVGPSTGGGGGGGGGDATTVLATGDIKARFGVGPIDGFVRCNGNTIGSAVSGATERAAADCQALFEYLWSTNAVGIFAGGSPARGASAHGDWVANKRCETPDLRGRSIHGLDDMGNAPANRLTAVFWGAGIISPFDLGNASGVDHTALVAASQLPLHDHAINDPSHVHGNILVDLTHTHDIIGDTATESALHQHQFSISGTTGPENQSHTHGYTATLGAGAVAPGGVGASIFASGATTGTEDQAHDHAFSGSGFTDTETVLHSHGMGFTSGGANSTPMDIVNVGEFTGITIGGTGSSAPFTTSEPSMVMTFYIKL